MRPDAIAVGIAGVVFGLLSGWVIGSQQAVMRGGAAPVAASAPASAPAAAAPTAPVLDQNKVNALSSVAQQQPTNPQPRIDLGNLYFDSERYADAIKWYGEAFKLNPKDVNVSTDLGVSYYYTNQPDQALAQFEESLKIDPKHTKTLLNQGIVRAFGKQDLAGAEQAWQQVIQIDPNGPEGQAAKRALDSLKSAHPGGNTTTAAKPGA
ncbi:MAG: tetratricopeptide repeat protein [Vicinamibacterales bacterium]